MLQAAFDEIDTKIPSRKQIPTRRQRSTIKDDAGDIFRDDGNNLKEEENQKGFNDSADSLNAIPEPYVNAFDDDDLEESSNQPSAPQEDGRDQSPLQESSHLLIVGLTTSATDLQPCESAEMDADTSGTSRESLRRSRTQALDSGESDEYTPRSKRPKRSSKGVLAADNGSLSVAQEPRRRSPRLTAKGS
jgi:hypothetical protein